MSIRIFINTVYNTTYDEKSHSLCQRRLVVTDGKRGGGGNFDMKQSSLSP